MFTPPFFFIFPCQWTLPLYDNNHADDADTDNAAAADTVADTDNAADGAVPVQLL